MYDWKLFWSQSCVCVLEEGAFARNLAIESE